MDTIYLVFLKTKDNINILLAITKTIFREKETNNLNNTRTKRKKPWTMSAIVGGVAVLIAAAYCIRVKCCKKKENDSETKSGEEDNNDTEDKRIDEENDSETKSGEGDNNSTEDSEIDEENQSTPRYPRASKSEFAN